MKYKKKEVHLEVIDPTVKIEKIHGGNMILEVINATKTPISALTRHLQRGEAPFRKALLRAELRADLIREVSNAMGVDFFYRLSGEAVRKEAEIENLKSEIANLNEQIRVQKETFQKKDNELKEAIQKKDNEIEKRDAVIAALKEVAKKG